MEPPHFCALFKSCWSLGPPVKTVAMKKEPDLILSAQLDELHHQDLSERENYQRQIEELKARCEEKRARVDEERRQFVEFKKQVALNSINSRSGKPIAPKVCWCVCMCVCVRVRV